MVKRIASKKGENYKKKEKGDKNVFEEKRGGSGVVNCRFDNK